MTTFEPDYPLIDLDNHFYEPDDCFSRYIDPAFADRAVNVRRGGNGLGQVYIGDQRLGFQSVTLTDFTGAPGTLRGYFYELVGQTPPKGTPSGRLGAIENAIRPREIAAFTQPKARLELMDEQNVEAVLMLPTLGVCVEHELADDREVAVANLRAFNRWLEDDWGFHYADRIFTAPLISLVDVDFAVEEVKRAAGAGARAVTLRVGPVYGKSPADPAFDAFWAEVADADLPVVLHTCDSGYPELFSTGWGERARPAVHQYTAFQMYTCFIERPIADMTAALILHNLFARFPGLRILCIENGSRWVGPLLKQLDKAWRGAKGRDGIGGEVTEQPSEIFRRHFRVTPYPEDDVPELIDTIGADNVLLGSDFPHAEGTAHPIELIHELGGVSPGDVRKIMRDNAARELRLDRR